MGRQVLKVISVVIAILTLALAPVSAQQSNDQLSPAGGIGNTRADFIRAWGPLRELNDPFVMGQQEYVNYDTPDYDIQLMVMYFVEKDGKPRDTDRVGWFLISYVESTSLRNAERDVQKYIPTDARLERNLTNQFGEPREVYKSDDALQLFPTLNVDGETLQGKGEIWVTYGTMGGSSVVAVEIGLYDDYAD